MDTSPFWRCRLSRFGEPSACRLRAAVVTDPAMSTTDDAMSSDDQTVAQQQPPERPAPSTEDEIDAEREAAHDPLATIEMSPGDRRTDDVAMLVIEAELACLEGKQLDNPAKPRTEDVGKSFRGELEKHDEHLVPAWTRPWEVDDDSR